MGIQVTDGENLNSMRAHSFFAGYLDYPGHLRTMSPFVSIHETTNPSWRPTINGKVPTTAYCVFKFVYGETVKFTNKCPCPRQIYRCSCHFSTCARTISVASNVVSEWHLYLYMPAIVGLYQQFIQKWVRFCEESMFGWLICHVIICQFLLFS